MGFLTSISRSIAYPQIKFSTNFTGFYHKQYIWKQLIQSLIIYILILQDETHHLCVNLTETWQPVFFLSFYLKLNIISQQGQRDESVVKSTCNSCGRPVCGFHSIALGSTASSSILLEQSWNWLKWTKQWEVD